MDNTPLQTAPQGGTEQHTHHHPAHHGHPQHAQHHAGHHAGQHHPHPHRELEVSITGNEVAGKPDEMIIAISKLHTGLEVETATLPKATYQAIESTAAHLATLNPGAAIKNAAMEAMISAATARAPLTPITPDAVNHQEMVKVAQGAAGKKYPALLQEFSEAARKPRELAVPAPVQTPGVQQVEASNYLPNQALAQGAALGA